MCCGQNRTALRNSQAQGTTRTVPQHVSSNSRAQAVRTQSSAPPAMQTASPYQPANTQTRSIQPQHSTPTSTPHSSVSVRYLENSPIRVRGLISGMSYEFSASRPVQAVDARDASSLLNTRFFRRA
jgi:hypothetical protein